MKNTVALYTFYEKNGIVRDFVLYYLEELKKEISDIIVIVNGKLSPEGRLKLEKIGVDILVRENKGLDFGAWKAGIEYVGWEKIRKLDGLLLCNCTCYGPVYPFKEIFDAMAKKDCDFWGINRHPEMDVYLIPNDPCSKVKEHIQSYFLFFKPHLLKSNHFNLISPSRDDPMPVVMTEGLMLQKICLCSTNCGTADYIEDGKNGFVFQSENAWLKKLCILSIILKILIQLGFSVVNFTKNILHLRFLKKIF